MGLPRFFNLAKPRQFHYEPVYYDERKERLQEKIREVEQKMGVQSDGQFKRTLGRGSFSARHLRGKKTSKQSTIRLIVIFIFILLISYLLLFF
jgi:hypothetical protein